MKKVLILAVASMAMVFASCKKETGPVPQPEPEKVEYRDFLVVKLANGAPAETRVFSGPGAAATNNITLRDGYIFIIDASGSVVARQALNPTAATSGAGQTITGPIATNSKVYIIGNIPAGFDVSTLTTFDAIDRAVISLSKGNQPTSFRDAMVANTSGVAEQISVGTPSTPTTPGSATVNLAVSPLYSRLELWDVRGNGNVSAFTVTGVFVDSYFSQFTPTGKAAGPIKYQRQSTDWTDNIGDTGNWPATGTTGNMISSPNPNPSSVTQPQNVWAYHMAAADLPRVIVQLAPGMTYTGTGTVASPTAQPTYITVKGYTAGVGTTVPASFQRGRVYRIGADATGTPYAPGSQNALIIDPTKISSVPNDDYVTITARITVSDWTIVPLTPQI